MRNILVMELGHIGDVVLGTPVLKAMREHFPGARISALVGRSTEPVLTGNHLVDEVLVYDETINSLTALKRYREYLSVFRMLQQKCFDMTVGLKTGGLNRAEGVMSFVTGAPYRLGIDFDHRGSALTKILYTHPCPFDRHKHKVLQGLDVIRQIGITVSRPSISWSHFEENAQFMDMLRDKYSIDANAAIIHVHPVSRLNSKCWKDEYMAEIIRWLLSKGIAVMVTSSENAVELARTRKILSMAGPHPNIIDLSGKTTITQLGAVSAMAQMFFGVDGAPMHIAAAVDTPVIALFGPIGAFQWGPWDNQSVQIYEDASPYRHRNGVQTFGKHTVIQKPWACVPCMRNGCNNSTVSRCLTEMGPKEVMDVIEKRLN